MDIELSQLVCRIYFHSTCFYEGQGQERGLVIIIRAFICVRGRGDQMSNEGYILLEKLIRATRCLLEYYESMDKKII